MADGIVGLQPDSTGKKVDTTELTVGANLVERQRVQLAGSNAGDLVTTRGDGFLRTAIDPSTLLYDTFETVDTTNTWTLGGTAPTGANGILNINAGSAASATSYAFSKPTFVPSSSAFLQAAMLVTVQATTVTGANQFWGLGITGTPTTALPITNGVIFEIDTTGALLGSVYSNSARTQTVALTKPTDGTTHRYALYYKASRVYFEIDNITVGSLAFPNPGVSALSSIIGQANSATVTGTPTLTATLMGVADTGRNANMIADGTYAWRKAQVGKSGGLSVKGTSIVGTSGSIAAAATGTIGPVDVSEAGNVTFAIKNTVAGSPYAGAPVVVFEQSDDNVSWGPLGVVRSDSGVVASSITLSPNSANASLMFDTALEGVNWIRARVTTGPTTNAMTIVIAPGTLAFSPAISIGNTANIQPAQSTTTVGAITSATSIVSIPTVGQSIVSVVINGTYAGVSIGFEATVDGTTWFTITGTYSGNGSSTSGFFGLTNSLQNADVPLYAYTQFRVRATAWTSGSATITLATKAISAAPFFASIAQGTVTNGAATFANPLLMGGTDGTNARSVFVKAASVAAAAADQAMVVALSPNSAVTQATITKGTQGTTGVTTQDLKDAGRIAVSYNYYRQAGIITTEAVFPLNSLGVSREGNVAGAATQGAVTVGKRYRVQAITVTLFNNAAAACTSKLVLRASAAGGTITNTSLAMLFWDLGTNSVATANYIGPVILPIPDGLEFASGTTFAFSNLSSAATVLHTINLVGFEY